MTGRIERAYRESPLFASNAPYVFELYSAWRNNPEDVAAHWRDLFESIEAGRPLPTRLPNGGGAPVGSNGRAAPAVRSGASRQGAVVRLIQLYRLRGYRAARVDPLQLNPNLRSQAPKLEYAGLSEADLDAVFDTGRFGGAESRQLPLRTIVEQLEQIYCRDVGVEMAHVSRARERLWLRDRVEAAKLAGRPPDPVKRAILRELIAAEGLERYLHTRYVGQKRFSLEGGDSLIPMLYDLIQQAGAKGLQEIVIGMAHRGRINVLVNVLGKAPQDLYAEFAGEAEPLSGKYGDVKYHMGFSSDVTTPGGLAHVVLAFNPSHLEIVNPVVLGSVRARMDRRRDSEGDEILPVLIHGDAAVAGQGVVAETLQLSQARSFTTGGTVHLIINNQIGFTTSDPQDARSTPYCSDVAKMIESPVIHVNGDSPEACVFATRLALEYRQAFHKDVFVDLVCYRRHGHNEADEPAATQPLMYERIRNHPTTLQMYADRLCEQGVVTRQQLEADKAEYRSRLEAGDPLPEAAVGMVGNEFTVDWDNYRQADAAREVDTAITAEGLADLAERLGTVPEGVRLNPRVEKVVADRLQMARGEIDMDWGFGELMAYGSLLRDGYRVRLTGQDSRRGTFFHRHASLIDQHSGRAYSPLDDVAPKRGAFTITDSLLSEEAVMGFEYGYSTTDPDCLTIWEGQFGDFCNGAQVVIDQFIASGDTKWGRMSGLTLFLPHGQEGAGPEHSSARLERFLQLCAQGNMRVCVPSTPGQIFHLLRRQMHNRARLPLVVLTPKSLLRNKLSFTPIQALSEGRFERIIDEIDELDDVRRLVLCSGKLYFDLLEARREGDIGDVAIVRIEQLYPFPHDLCEELFKRYANVADIVWAQEEPKNQGAWYRVRARLERWLVKGQRLRYMGRAGAASPAPGSMQLHRLQQYAIVEQVLDRDRKAAV